MTITYSLWDGMQLLGVDFKASSADEMNTVVSELQKVSKNVVAHMRKVEVAQWSSTQTQITSLSTLTTYTLAVQQQRYLHGYCLALLLLFGQ